MRQGTRHRFGAAAAVLGLLLIGGTGCGSAADKAAEKAIEKATGGDVTVDSGGDGMKIETEDGTITTGTSAKLPDEWPDDVKIPDGMKIVSATVLSSGETPGMSVIGTSSASIDDLMAFFDTNLSGWKKVNSGDHGSGADRAVMMMLEDGARTLTVSLSPSDGAPGTTASIMYIGGND